MRSAVDIMQAEFSTSPLPPVGLEVSLNPPQPRVPQARTLTLALIEELVQALAFQHEVIMTLMRIV